MPTSLHQRATGEEIMDDFDCQGEVVDQTLRELHLINTYLGGNNLSLDGIKKLVKSRPQETYELVDLGCGGGDTLQLFADWAISKNHTMQLTGVDANPYIVDYARMHCANYANIDFAAENVFAEAFQRRQFDIAHASLFLHHFQTEELVQLLKQLMKQVRVGIVINDLHRHWLSYFFTRYAIAPWSKSEMVKYDSILSVARSFVRADLETCLALADIQNYTLRWKWAFRWQLIVWK